MLCESTYSSTPCCTALLWHYVSYCDIITQLSYSYNPNLWLCPKSLSMFGIILCLLRRVLVQIWSAVRTANCCSASRKQREAVSAIGWVARNQFCNSSRKLLRTRRRSAGLIRSQEKTPDSTVQHSTDSTTPGHWDRSSRVKCWPASTSHVRLSTSVMLVQVMFCQVSTTDLVAQVMF